MKRILLVIKGLGRGGAEQLLATAAPYLDRGRFEYEVAYLLAGSAALLPDVERHGVRVHCLRSDERSGWVLRLRSLIAERRYDLVHTHSPYVGVGTRLALARAGGRSVRPRLVHTEHSVWEAYHPVTRLANMITFQRNDYVFAVSNHVFQSFAAGHAWPLGRMPPAEALYHGIDPEAVSALARRGGVREELGIPQGAPVFGTVANFTRQKGYPHLLRAAARVRARIPDAKLVVVGQGTLEGEIRRDIRDLGLEDMVILTGGRDDAPRIAAEFDVFVLASVQEGLSIALIEAMHVGRPAVVTQVGGLPELVDHGVQGLVVPPRDPAALSDAITRLLEDPELRGRFGRAARIRANALDIRDSVHRIEEVYGELLACPRP